MDMKMLRKYVAACLLLSLCIPLLCGCAQEPQTEPTTEPTEAQVHTIPPIPYDELPNIELMRMMCCCPCNTLADMYNSGWPSTLTDVLELGEKCPIIGEFFSRPYVIRDLTDEGYEIYSYYASYPDRSIIYNAQGFGKLLRFLCPYVFEKAKEQDAE